MGNARFDTGHEYRWYPLGVYTKRQSTSAARAALVGIGAGAPPFVRVDWASICLEYDGGIGNASGQLELGASGGPYTSFVNVAGYAPAIVEAEISVPSPFYADRVMNQTSSPFYTGTPFTIWIVGESALLAPSWVSGTVGLSGSWGIP